ncbi:unnamed protein product [Clonostachys rhizophaga]|uniref:Uncharacterized protein n=1 Tax=Clonostachys rhizophaga TaxID=160324 RepID=A0A9N9VAH4_9HYPO|nr:unnamed protein product [Clonostachys rhizophaga]
MLFLRILTALSATLVVAIFPILNEQVYLDKAGITSSTVIGDRVSRLHNVTFGPVPKAEQIYVTDGFDIAPFPATTNQRLFFLLFGRLPSSKTKHIKDLEAALTKATLNITMNRLDPDGKPDEPSSNVIPLRAFRGSMGTGQLSIRHTNGTYVDYLPGPGESEILAEFIIVGMFVGTGLHTFDLVARLGDENNTCLFAFSHTQWLENDFD